MKEVKIGMNTATVGMKTTRSRNNSHLDTPTLDTEETVIIRRKKSKEADPNVWNSDNEGVHIPSLFMAIFHNGIYRPMTANTPRPVRFETDLFDGELLLLINTKPICDQYYPRFEGHHYTFDMQVQGKFKTIPKGILYMGAEITKKMELGLFTRGLCSSILQVGRAVNPYIHHSFGDANNVELPHIVGPFWSLFDRLEITPPGGIVPKLGGLLAEGAQHRLKRRKTPYYKIDLSLENTYRLGLELRLLKS
jgi:hypothetical protein